MIANARFEIRRVLLQTVGAYPFTVDELVRLVNRELDIEVGPDQVRQSLIELIDNEAIVHFAMNDHGLAVDVFCSVGTTDAEQRRRDDSPRNVRQMIDSLGSRVCPACGMKAKVLKHSLCYGCYRKLPWEKRVRLYDVVGDGYEEAVAEAFRHLNVIRPHWPRMHEPQLLPGGTYA